MSTVRLSDPTHRAVMEDALREQGRSLRLPERCYDDATDATAAAAAADDAADAAAADDDAAADAAATAAADADDADDADAAADDAADTDAADAVDTDAADDAYTRISTRSLAGADMVHGFVLVQVPGRSGWKVTLLAWAREVRPDEWELVNARAISRESFRTPRKSCAEMAQGLPEGHVLAPASTEYAHRFDLTRCRRANEKAYAEHCPKPEGWEA